MFDYENTVREEVAVFVLRTADDDDSFFELIVEARANSVCRQLSRLGMSVDENGQQQRNFVQHARRLRSAWMAVR